MQSQFGNAGQCRRLRLSLNPNPVLHAAALAESSNTLHLLWCLASYHISTGLALQYRQPAAIMLFCTCIFSSATMLSLAGVVSSSLQFLPQDKVVEFARMDQYELLVATEKAIGDASLHETHMQLIDKRVEVKQKDVVRG